MMRRHARAVILLGGWLLMQAPHNRGTLEGDLDAPLSQWTQLVAFDTAKECEQERVRVRRAVEARLHDALQAPVVSDERCVPSEAVYAPRPPAQQK